MKKTFTYYATKTEDHEAGGTIDVKTTFTISPEHVRIAESVGITKKADIIELITPFVTLSDEMETKVLKKAFSPATLSSRANLISLKRKEAKQQSDDNRAARSRKAVEELKAKMEEEAQL